MYVHPGGQSQHHETLAFVVIDRFEQILNVLQRKRNSATIDKQRAATK